MINVAEEMKHLHKLAKCDPDKRFNHLWEKLLNPEWLAQAWEQIRSNKGSQTAGIDNQTAVDIDLSRIIKLAERLRTGVYRPRAVRRRGRTSRGRRCCSGRRPGRGSIRCARLPKG